MNPGHAWTGCRKLQKMSVQPVAWPRANLDPFQVKSYNVRVSASFLFHSFGNRVFATKVF